MPDAELGQDRIDGSDRDARTSASIANARCSDVIFSVGLNQRQGCEALDDLGLCLRSREALKKLLQDKPGRHDDLVALERILERLNLGFCRLSVTPKRERPNAGVDEDRHALRKRSAL